MTDRFKIALEVFNRLIPSLEHSLEQRLRDFHNNEPIDDMLACVREALTRPSREEKLLEALQNIEAKIRQKKGFYAISVGHDEVKKAHKAGTLKGLDICHEEIKQAIAEAEGE